MNRNGTSSPAVEVERVSKKFLSPDGEPSVYALDDVNLKVAEGEFVALLGPSGCGKTTLLRIIAGQETPSSGVVRIGGQDLTHVPPEKRPVNMVFQTPALFPHMNVFDNIAFGPRLSRAAEQDVPLLVKEMLALVRLEGFGQRRVTQLSGGQAQRVALARALVNRPKVLLLDEPLSALDLKLRQAMQLELRSIHRQLGTSFVYVTHDQSEALAMADRIVVMQSGRFLQVGTPIEIYHAPSTVFSSQFVGDCNVLSAKIVACRDSCWVVDLMGTRVVASVSTRPDGLTFKDNDNDATYLLIRPERIQVKAAESAAEDCGPTNRVVGRIIERIFVGPSVRYVIELDSNITIYANQSFQKDEQLLEIGMLVVADWQPQDCSILIGQ